VGTKATEVPPTHPMLFTIDDSDFIVSFESLISLLSSKGFGAADRSPAVASSSLLAFFAAGRSLKRPPYIFRLLRMLSRNWK
jgi:hypothetical protein